MKLNKHHKQKIKNVLFFGCMCATVIALVSYALRTQINFFYTPQELLALENIPQKLKLGGVVKTGSVARKGIQVDFIVTDGQQDLAVHYEGVLPNLFKEGQAVVLSGSLNRQTFLAKKILAKHDENYNPLGVSAS